MKMNEDAAKFDITLDNACKKYEKICMDNSPDGRELMWQDEITTKEITYKAFLQQFKWNEKKYSQN